MKNNKVERIKNTILNRVRFHSPVVYDDKIDRTVLFNNGVDVRYPIFKFDKKIDNKMLKALMLANKEEKFNLLIPIENITKIQEKILKKLENCVFYSQNSSMNFLAMICKLNINYSSSSSYDVKFKDRFFMINDQILNPKYDDFCLVEDSVSSINYSYREFMLNGNNIYLKIKNTENLPQKVKISLNFPLKRGYFYFKKQNGAIKVVNLMTKENMFFSYICPKAEFSFSCVDGLENSSFATINLKLTINLKPQEERFFFFQYSNKKFPLKTQKSVEKFLDISKTKNREIFDVRVKTKNPKFDQFFNNELPKKIWLNWINGVKNEDLIQKYMNLRRLFVKGKDKIDFQPFKQIGLKEVGIFNGEYYKKIVISFGREKYLLVGKTKFTNISNITLFSLKKKEPIFLSFDV